MRAGGDVWGDTMATTESRPREQVNGQVVVVTGGAGVIGRAICEAFGRAGAFVAVADLVEGPRGATVAAVRQAGGRALGIPLDVTDRTSGPSDRLLHPACRRSRRPSSPGGRD